MNEIDIRILFLVLFLVFGSAIAAFVKKIKNRLIRPKAPVFTTRFEFEDRDPVIFENQIIVMPPPLVRNAAQAKDSLADIPETQSDLLPILEKEFLAEQENKAFARAAIQTFKAWHHGLMLKVVDPDNTLPRRQKIQLHPKITRPAFKDFVLYRFLGIQNANLMPKTMEPVQQQYACFFKDYPLDETEFLLSWAQQAMLTSRSLILFTPGPEPAIQSVIPIETIKDVTCEQTGVERLA